MEQSDLRTAYQCYQVGNLPQAELMAREVLRTQPDSADARVLLGLIALWVRMYDAAAAHARQALSIAPGNATARKVLENAAKEKSLHQSAVASRGGTQAVRQKYLLIRSWGHGMWSDIDHVLGQLLLADMTGRTPVVHWGENSLYWDPGTDDVFGSLFEPVSATTPADLIDKRFSYFPAKWSDANITTKDEDVNKWYGPYSRMTGLYFLGRDEDVVVSDFHSYLADLVPWIDAGQRFYGAHPQKIYRHLVAAHLRPKQDILNAVEQFWRTEMKDRLVLGVHVRGSDKVEEMPDLLNLNNSYRSRIDNYLDLNPQALIFLFTDSEKILDSYRQTYGQRLVSTDSFRTVTNQAVHFHAHGDKRRIAAEVIRDVYIAAKCQHFIGNGGSNVSTSVLHLRNWDPSEYELVNGQNDLFVPNLAMHWREPGLD